MLAGLLPAACSHDTSQDEASDAAPRADGGASPDANAAFDGGDEAAEARGPSDAGEDALTRLFDASGPDAEAALRSRYKVVLHLGDSEVGFGGGLTKALRRRFEAHHITFVSNSLTAAGLQSYDAEPRVRGLVKSANPDLVILNLGTNNLTVPHPEGLIGNIKSLVKKVSTGRDCVWVGPPHLPAGAKRESAMDDVLRENVAPCRYFESMHLKLALQKDHIHPTDRGGEVWADQLFRFIVFDEPPRGPFLDDEPPR